MRCIQWTSWSIVAVLAAACAQEVPGAGQFAATDAAGDAAAGELSDFATTGDAAADVADASALDADATPDAPDAAIDVAQGPTCTQALDCLVAKKQWLKGGRPPKTLACLDGIDAAQGAEIDAVLACAGAECGKQLNAWDAGGAVQYQALQVCLIDKCAKPLAVCLGGGGDKTCKDAIYCLKGCNPTDAACSYACLGPTTGPHSEKAGAFLSCALTQCGGMAKLPSCNIPLSCAVSCPELGG